MHPANEKPISSSMPASPRAERGKLWWKLLLYSIPIIILLAAAIPNYVRARVHPCKNSCINNLRQIDGAKEQFALEAKLQPGDQVTEEQIGAYLKGSAVPKCPGDGTITIGAIGSSSTCSSQEGHRITTAPN